MGRLDGKIAIVTGASSGIGRATALAFSNEGAAVVCSDIRPSPNPSTTGEDQTATHEVIAKAGGKSLFVQCDVTVASEVESLVQRTVQEFGRLDIMFNNAGIAFGAGTPLPVWDVDEKNWEGTMAVNAKGVFFGCKYAAKQMITQEPGKTGDRGWIVNTASILALGGSPGTLSYCASKHAVAGITKTVALDCAPYRVHCNAICPGYTTTAMTAPIFASEEVKEKVTKLHPFRGLGEPNDLARSVVYLASEENSWMTGVLMPVDGGYSAI